MSLVKDMGMVIGQELRAYYNAEVHDSLDTWSPTINLNRDPRWGRNVESPGEDPLLCGSYGTAYTQGLQDVGGDPKYRQATVTLKHWVAYSVESYHGTTRHNFNAKVSPYDLSSSFFPAWEKVVKEGGAKGVMCSYNMLNGKPTCGNANLTKYLREDWGFTGYITSDTDSCADILNSHKFEKTGELATRDCLVGGTDIDSGSTYKNYLAKAVQEGSVNRTLVDAALHNSFKMRFEMGMFDPTVPNAYNKITTDVIGCGAHQEMSLLAAKKGIVLLKNAKSVLPLTVGKKIALIGQNADDTMSLTGNYDGRLCPKGGASCWPSIYKQASAMNTGGTVSLVTDIKDSSKAVAAAKAADYVVMIIDNAKDGGGEGHDRDTISLSSDQMSTAVALVGVGKPLVLVMVNGGIISLDGLKNSASAILNAFMPGVHGGEAIAATLFGANNPGGKLPVTMYHSNYTNEVDFLNMSMTAGPGRSYRYYTGTPLYPFGFGLSYTDFSLSWTPQPPPKQPTMHVTAGKTLPALTYSVIVKNTGKVAGDEVVLAYFKPSAMLPPTLALGTPVEKKRLFAFERIHLKAGASQTLKFTVNATDMALVNLDGHTHLHAGEYEVLFSRGHGHELVSTIAIKTESPLRLKTFRPF
jgi:beta-glucosidase-like glycosyl hydrolase